MLLAQPFYLSFLIRHGQGAARALPNEREAAVSLIAAMGIGISPRRGIDAEIRARVSDICGTGGWKTASIFHITALDGMRLQAIDFPIIPAREMDKASLHGPLLANPASEAWVALMHRNGQDFAFPCASEDAMIQCIREIPETPDPGGAFQIRIDLQTLEVHDAGKPDVQASYTNFEIE